MYFDTTVAEIWSALF